jgi:hypothetical protein
MIKEIIIKYLTIFIIGFIIGTLFFKSCTTQPLINKEVIKIKHDTLTEYITIEKDPVIIHTKPSSFTYTRIDTIIKTNPFIAKLDTSAKGIDSLRISYKFPENKFDFRAYLSPDTLEIRTITKETTKETYLEPAWYEKPPFVILATLLGLFTFDRIIK